MDSNGDPASRCHTLLRGARGTNKTAFLRKQQNSLFTETTKQPFSRNNKTAFLRLQQNSFFTVTTKQLFYGYKPTLMLMLLKLRCRWKFWRISIASYGLAINNPTSKCYRADNPSRLRSKHPGCKTLPAAPLPTAKKKIFFKTKRGTKGVQGNSDFVTDD